MSRRFFRRLTDPKRRDRARFIGDIFIALNRAFQEEAERHGLTKAELAKRLGVHRSLVTRRLRGQGNLTFETLHDMAWAMDRRVVLALPRRHEPAETNSHTETVAIATERPIDSASEASETFTTPEPDFANDDRRGMADA